MPRSRSGKRRKSQIFIRSRFARRNEMVGVDKFTGVRIGYIIALFPEFMDLRRKFEEDKAKIQKLKEARRFKPY